MATDQLHQFYQQASTWAEQAQKSGWLSETDVEKIKSVEARTPTELFENGTQRPLVVAFFGGTGVGKSSLLNRLAGQAVARTGVERPTSREVTIYVHKSVQIQNLPEEFPVDKVKIALHQEEKNHDILWIDMPDIDSVDTSNKELVLEWLPHIDVLIYVVSPERYRDDRGWRLLLEHGHRHAWLFVINQWDKGQESQREDFTRLLNEAGFKHPIVLCTDSREKDHAPDDFEKLAQTIRSLANAHTIKQLETRGISLRMQELRKTLQQIAKRIGTDESFSTLQQRWQEIWETASAELEQGLAWKIESMAESFATRDAGLLQRFKKNESEQPTGKPTVDTAEMWDNWAQTRLNDALDNLIVEADAQTIPTAPLRTELPEIRDNARGWLENHLQTSLRAALLKPGTALQRFIYRTTGVLATILPLAALSWVGYRVFVGYYQSALAPEQYLGINFTTHSLLLVLTAWLIPWFAHRKLKPSLQKSALRGLQTGLSNGLSEIETQTRKIIEKLRQKQQQLCQQSEQILQKYSATEAAPQLLDNETLTRMLVTEPEQNRTNPETPGEETRQPNSSTG